MSGPFVGPLPYAELPAQPRFDAWCLNWQAYDVPRIWDIVRSENDPRGWEQINGFRQLSELLVDHYRRLLSQRLEISRAWQSPTGEALLSRVDTFAQSLLSDANCAMTTAHALDRIMTTYARAREQVASLEQEWNRITTDWVPEWWDNAAAELNVRAQDIMSKTDKAVADYRTQIIIPRAYDNNGRTFDPVSYAASNNPNSDRIRRRPIPSIPGHEPLTRSQNWNAELASMAGSPALIPAIPGLPVSMLPIPPSSQYAPYGGAYILPGPGVGSRGYVVPMPGSANSGPLLGWNSTGSTSGVGGVGMLPMMPGAQQLRGQRHDRLYSRNSDTVWHVAKGVPSIIGPIDAKTCITDQPTEEQEENFADWFTHLAFPWRSETPETTGPQVTFRRAET